MLAVMAMIAAWLFRTSSAPLAVKIGAPRGADGPGVRDAVRGQSDDGLPVTVSFAALPDHAELVAFVAHDDAGSVDLWLRSGDIPRAYETRMDDALKKTLREARERMAHGRPAMLAKRGTHKDGAPGSHPSGVGGIGDDQKTYILDDSAFNLPSKD